MKTLTRLLSYTLLVSFMSSVACRKTTTRAPSTPSPPTTAQQQSQLNHPEGGVTPAGETRYFKGSIGNSLDLQMKLVRNGDQLKGSYYYQKVGTKIELRGSVDKEGSLTLEEFDPNGKQTGLFKGIWTTDKDGLVALAGNWSKPPTEKGSDKKTAFSIHELPIHFTADVEVINKQVKDSNKQLKYEIDAQYPQLSVTADPLANSKPATPTFDKFNETVRSSVMKKIAEFKKDMATSREDDSGPETMGSSIDIGYTIELAQDDLISVDFSVGSYYHGAAHPNSYSETINYDLKNGKQLKLSDLFKPGSKYLQLISAYAISDLKKQSKEKSADGLLDDASIESGAGPTPKNYGSWTITKKGLGINFDPYQVGPYAAGPQYVLIPYAALKDSIALDGPLGQFMK